MQALQIILFQQQPFIPFCLYEATIKLFRTSIIEARADCRSGGKRARSRRCRAFALGTRLAIRDNKTFFLGHSTYRNSASRKLPGSSAAMETAA